MHGDRGNARPLRRKRELPQHREQPRHHFGGGEAGKPNTQVESVSHAIEEYETGRSYLFSLAFRLICAFSSFETGHPLFAALASSLNLASSMLGTRAFSSRSTLVIAQPPSFCSRLTLAAVRISSAVNPAFSNCAESAMEKQPAWAAAISSSGLVPRSCSKRVRDE